MNGTSQNEAVRTMKWTLHKLSVFSVLVGCLMLGCTRPGTRQTAQQSTQNGPRQTARPDSGPQISPAASLAMRLSDHEQWIRRLLASPSESGVMQASATAGSSRTVPIPTSAGFVADHGYCTLTIDQHAQLAWLQTGDTSHGPWKLGHPDIVHIIDSLQSPPEGVAVQPPPASL